MIYYNCRYIISLWYIMHISLCAAIANGRCNFVCYPNKKNNKYKSVRRAQYRDNIIRYGWYILTFNAYWQTDIIINDGHLGVGNAYPPI